jgi:metal-responsive CopG/Arc/MetJ family transcriptional regulator
MKTAISIPDPLFQAADELAQKLGVSRSELYSTAVKAYIQSHRYDGVTERLNEIYAEESSELDDVLSEMQWRSLPKEDW